MKRLRFLGLAWSTLALATPLNAAQESTPAVRRLQLNGAAVEQAWTPIELAAIEWVDLTQEGATDDWILGDAKLEVLPNGPQMVCAIHHPELVRFVLPAAIKFRDTPRLTLDVVVRGKPLELRAQLMRKGKVQREARVRLETGAATQHVVLDFDPVPAGEMTCDRIALLLPPGPYPLGIVGIRIEDAAVGGSIPAEAFGGVAMISLGNEARPGTCLSAQADLSCEFQVEDPSQRLAFSYATPKSVMTGGAQPKLKLTLSAQGLAPKEWLYEFLEKPSAQPTWRRSELSLAMFAGKTVKASFQLQVENSKAQLAALGVPKLILPQAKPAAVLLITADAHRSDHLGFLPGNGRPQTPTLDALAAEGVAFLDATASSNDSVRSHQVLFSGNPLAKFDLGQEHAGTLAEQFAKLGYTTYASVSSGDLEIARAGFDRFSSPGLDGRRSAKESIQKLTEWIEQAGDTPLFAWVQLSEANGPYEPPKRVLSKYYPKNLDPFDVTSPVSAFEFAPKWNPLIGDPFFTEALYDGSITHLDEQLTGLLEIERFAQAVVAYVGSHGENLRKAGEHRFGHGNLSRATLAVPLIIRAPQIKQGTHNPAPVSTRNLGRTLLDLLGHKDAAFLGSDLFKASPAEAAPRLALREDAGAVALLDQQWFLHLNLNTNSVEEQHAARLFRQTDDPNCLTDLAQAEAPTAARLRRLLTQRIAEESKLPGGQSGLQLDSLCPCANCESFR